MKKNFTLLKTMLVVALFSFVGASLNAQTITVSHTFSGTSGEIDPNISFTTQKNSANAPAYVSELRLYSKRSNGNGNTITFTPKNGAVINSITFTKASSDQSPKLVTCSVDGGEVSNITEPYSISGINASSSVVIQNAHQGGSKNKQMRVVSVEVTYTIDTTTPTITTTPSDLSFSSEVGGIAVTEVITVTGANLTDGITAAISGAAQFTLSSASLPVGGGNITVTYTPSETADTHTATLTLSSTGAPSVEIALSGVTNPAGLKIETFDQLDFTGSSYTTGSFVGNNDVSWAYKEARGDDEITGKALMLGKGQNPASELSATIHNGIVMLSFDYKQAYGTDVNLEVYVDDELITTVTTNSQGGEVINSGMIPVNKQGDVVLKFINTASSAGQVTIDNISWTSYLTTVQDGNWYEKTIWSEERVPTSSDNVIIAHNVSSSAAVSVNNLTIKPGASLKVDGVLTSTNPVILQGDATNGAATLISNNAVEGKMTYPLSPNRSWYVSSPVANASKSSLGEASQVYYRDEANDNYSEAGETLEVGRGYVIKPSTDVVMEFSGFFKTGATMVSVSNNGNAGDKYRGYNLIGNPYPAALNWETVYNNNANAINPTMWYNENGVFKTYIATSGVSVPADVKGYVPPMQGFWVLKAAEYTAQGENPSTATLNFDNTMLSHNTFETANLLKAPAISENQILRLQLVDDNNMKDETVIYFNAKAKNGYGDYDSRKMFNEKGSSLYTNVAGQKLVINGMNTIPYDKEIALNLFIKESGSFTISANEFSNFTGEKVWLRDNLKGVDHDLLSGDYTFTADENTSNGRFSVIFPRLGAPTGLEEILNDALSLSVDNGNLQVRVKDVAEDAMVSVFNSLGQRVASQSLRGTVTTVNLSNAGVYIVKVMNGSEELTEKVVVR